MTKLISFIMVLFLSLAGSSLSFAESPEIKKTVRIGAFNFYPGIFKGDDGSVQGIYVDFLEEIAKREGWQIEYVYGNWADGLSRIKNREVDVLTSVAWTEERTAYLDYAKVPLLTVWGELYTTDKSNIDSIREVKGKKIAVMKGDFNGANFRNLVDKFSVPCRFVEYGNFEEIFNAVASREVDAGVVNNTFGSAKADHYKLISSGIIFNPFDIFFAVAKGEDGGILATLDQYLLKWRASNSSPYHKARQRWAHANSAPILVAPSWLFPTLITLSAISGGAAIFIYLLRLQVRRKTSEITAHAEERKKIEATLFFINESGSHHRGDALLSSITAHLGRSLGVELVFISQLIPGTDRARTRAIFSGGAEMPDFDYDLKGTPCANVIGKSLCFYPSNVMQLFPEDMLLADMQAEGYAAIPLWDSQGVGIGLLGIVSRRPLGNSPLVETMLQIVSSRVAQEMEAMNYLETLKLKNFTIETIRDAVFWVSPEAKILDVNRAVSTILGYSRDELLSMKVSDLEQDFSQALWWSNWEQLTQMGSLQFEKVHRTKSGQEIPVEITANYVTYNGTECICAIVRDISERKRMEEQLRQSQKMEAIGLLAGGVAHDFNNILTVIVGYGNMLTMDDDLGDLHRGKVEQIIAAADRAAQLTLGLLTFSRKQVLAPQIIDLNQVVHSTQMFLLRVIGEDIKLRVASHHSALKVFADRSQIEQIIINLATNARDAMSQGGALTIETSLQLFDQAYAHAHGYGAPGSYACLIMSDTGSGMNRETRERIFEPFFTTKMVGKGTGLGMAMVYGIVKQHKGFIYVYSEPGEGTTFKIYLPLAEHDGVELEEVAVAEPLRGGGETILVAEDDADVRKLVHLVLSKFGYTVILAVDGQDCVEKFQANQDAVGLVLLDMIMPVKNGKEAFEEIKLIQPEARVLYSSGYTADFIENRGVLDPGVDLIMKPVEPDKLLRRIREILDR